jgi:hypothetical protein
VYVNFYYKLILIKKFTKHNQLNDPCCAIRYFDLYLSFNFCNFIFIYCQFFSYQIISISWFRTHDRHIILTYLISRSWILRVNPVLPRAIFFSFIFYCWCLIFLWYYRINQNLTWISNFSHLFKNMIVFYFFLVKKNLVRPAVSRKPPI